MQTIVIVDPEVDFLEWAAHQLETPTTRVLTATRTDEAYRIYFAEDADLLITDTHLQPFSGLELLARVRQKDPNAMVVLTSAFGTTQSVIESMKLGAYDFIRKEALPFNLKVVVDTALKTQAEMRAATAFKPQLTVEQHQDSIVGQSEAMQQVFKMIGRVAHSDAPVMITGESGSGKELVARAIHHYSRRSEQVFRGDQLRGDPRARCWRASFSAMRRAVSPARWRNASGGSSRATAAHCFSTRLAKCRCRCRARFCGCCRRASFPVWAAT